MVVSQNPCCSAMHLSTNAHRRVCSVLFAWTFRIRFARVSTGSGSVGMDAIASRVLNSFPVVVLPAQCPGLVEYHAPGVYAGDRSHTCAIASEGKSGKHYYLSGPLGSP